MLQTKIVIFDYADGNEEPAGFYALGHHRQPAFRKAVMRHVADCEGAPDGALDVEVAVEINEAKVWLGYWKTKKLGEDEEEYRRCPKGTRGSYPVTVMEVAW